MALTEERESLRAQTLRQRERLRELEHEGKLLRTRLAGDEILRADLACENCARRCVADVALLELDGAEADKRRLEQELAGYRGGAARLRSSREADAQRVCERSEWRVACAHLERELAAARAKLAELDESKEAQARASSDLARHQAMTAAMREDFSLQRRLRSEAEWGLRAVQQELVQLRGDNLAAGVEAGRLEVENSRLADVRARLAQATEARRRQADALQGSLAELDALREELQRTTASNARLREGVQRSLLGLENIHRHSSEAQTYAASRNPRFDRLESVRSSSAAV